MGICYKTEVAFKHFKGLDLQNMTKVSISTSMLVCLGNLLQMSSILDIFWFWQVN